MRNFRRNLRCRYRERIKNLIINEKALPSQGAPFPFHMVTISPATAQEQIGIVRSLFVEYQRWLNVSLCFQGFDNELAGLPGKYAPPKGRLYLAEENGIAAGCIALRPMDEEGVCEMKRLYVKEEFRGKGIGRQLAVKIISDARGIGYRVMRLDTLQRMESARTLYTTLGFKIIPPYYHNPMEGVVYMELTLTESR